MAANISPSQFAVIAQAARNVPDEQRDRFFAAVAESLRRLRHPLSDAEVRRLASETSARIRTEGKAA